MTSRTAITRIAAILCLAAIGLSLGGCTKCGDFIWDDSPHACHSSGAR